MNFNDSTYTQYMGLRLYTYTEDDTLINAYDAAYINLSVRPVTAASGGVVCTLRIIGIAKAGDKEIRFPDYNSMVREVRTGLKAVAEIVTYDPSIKSDKDIDRQVVTKIISGRISQVARTNASYANMLKNQLEVTVVSSWDFLHIVPQGSLVSVSLKNINHLINESYLLKNKTTMEKELKAYLRISDNASSVNIPKLAAAVIDFAEARANQKSTPKKVFQAEVNTDASPKLMIPKSGVNNVITRIASICSDMLGRASSRQIYLSILSTFFYLLVPRVDAKTGAWQPTAIPNNIWGTTADDDGHTDYYTDKIIGLRQTAYSTQSSDIAGVAVRYVYYPSDMFSSIDNTRVSIYAHRPNEVTGKLEKVVIKAANGKRVKGTGTSGEDDINMNGSLLLVDLPSWIGLTYPNMSKASKEDWRDPWADFIATAEFAKHHGDSKLLTIQVTPNQLTSCMNSVGNIVSVNYTIDASKNTRSKEDNYYGRVAAVDFKINSDPTDFRTELTMTLQGVRNYEEQKALSIPNSTFFDNV